MEKTLRYAYLTGSLTIRLDLDAISLEFDISISCNAYTPVYSESMQEQTSLG